MKWEIYFWFLILLIIIIGVIYIPKNDNYLILYDKNLHNVRKNKMEEICRDLFEKIYNKHFIKVKPDFLKNKTGYNLELDGYNDELKIAFEYNGAQHYHYSPHFHKNLNDFEKQKEIDDLKQNLCIKNNIKLITIPYTLRESELYDFIKSKINDLN